MIFEKMQAKSQTVSEFDIKNRKLSEDLMRKKFYLLILLKSNVSKSIRLILIKVFRILP